MGITPSQLVDLVATTFEAAPESVKQRIRLEQVRMDWEREHLGGLRCPECRQVMKLGEE